MTETAKVPLISFWSEKKKRNVGAHVVGIPPQYVPEKGYVLSEKLKDWNLETWLKHKDENVDRRIRGRVAKPQGPWTY